MKRQSRSVLSSGYIALDLISYQKRLVHRAGGTATNVVANLAFFGWKAALAGVVGNDQAGDALRRDLKRAGVDAEALEARPGVETPLVLHEIYETGHRFRFHCPSCGRRFPKYRPLTEETASSLCETMTVPDVFFFDPP